MQMGFNIDREEEKEIYKKGYLKKADRSPQEEN